MRVALHVEDGPDVEEILALAPRKLLDLHGDTIGQLLPGRLDGGLPDQFPDQGLLGLVGHHLRGEVLRAFRQQPGDRLDQPIEVGPRETRDGNHAGERVQPADRGQTRHHLAGREPVDLVQHRQRGSAYAAEAGDRGPVLRCHAITGIKNEQHHVGVPERPHTLLDHPLAQSVPGPMQAGGIHEHDLGVGQRQDS